MSEARQDALSGQWTLYAPGRSGRPRQTGAPGEGAAPGEAGGSPPDRDPDCPFCPGNEDRLLSILHEQPCAEPPGWAARAVPNRFPALVDDPEPPAERAGPHRVRRVVGHQEVLIETPTHGRDLFRMTSGELEGVVELYWHRLRALSRERPGLYPFLFRNRGRERGASLVHPHGQLIAPDALPSGARRRRNRARRHYRETGECLVCRILAFEEERGVRRIVDSDVYSVFVPFGARVPLEAWIVPRRHRADFGGVEEDEKRELARLLGDLTRRLARGLGDPDYHLVLDSLPDDQPEARALHWLIRLRPGTSGSGGFEAASDVRINPSTPERDAEAWRGAG